MTTTGIRKDRQQYQADVQYIESLVASMECWETDAILAELGRIVSEFTIETIPVFDGRFGNVRRADGTYCYRIAFEMPGWEYQFNALSEAYTTLRAAALWAIKGALAQMPANVERLELEEAA